MDAMVIGEDAFINRPTRADFQRSGTYHVLVVSGMNVSILALVTFWFLRRLRVSDLFAGAITVSLMVAYALLTGLGSPVWRATLMLALYLGARLLYREKSMLNAIGAAALGLMIVNPQVLFGASFQLTFLCVWLVAAVGIPILERTTQPYLRGSRHIASGSYDFVLARECRAVSSGLANDCRATAAFCWPPHSLAGAGRSFAPAAGRERTLADLRGHADRTGASDGVLLPSRNGGGIASQHAGCALDGTADACRRRGHGAGIYFTRSGKDSGSDRRLRTRRHCRHGTLAGRIARRRSASADAGHDCDFVERASIVLAMVLVRRRAWLAAVGIHRVGRQRVLDFRSPAASSSPTRGAGDDSYRCRPGRLDPSGLT